MSMNIKHTKTKLTRAADVEIPDEFFNRLKTNIKSIDKVFGDGILPGMTFTLSADPGCGKTTLMLQICQALAEQDFTAAYLSGEESQEMVAFSCRRLGTNDVLIACANDMQTVREIADQVDLIIIDSFQSIQVDGMKASAAEAFKTNEIVSIAKEFKTAIGVIMHSTKSGNYKGSTLLPHAVDCNMRLEADGDNVRMLDVSKNRYGGAGCHTFFFGSAGYDFDRTIEVADQVKGKGAAKQQQLQAIMSMTEPPHINIERVCKHLNVDAQRAQFLLRLLTNENKLQKFGRGDAAVWKFVETSELQTA